MLSPRKREASDLLFPNRPREGELRTLVQGTLGGAAHSVGDRKLCWTLLHRGKFLPKIIVVEAEVS